VIARRATRDARRCALVLVVSGVLASAPASAQHFSLERAAAADSVLVGEVVVFRARVHIGPQQNLASPVPAVVGELPDGVRLLGADTLKPDGKRTVLAGDVRVAFYRPGRHQVPQLRLILKAIASDRGQALEPDPAWVDVGTTLPPGNPSLKDIRDGLPKAPVHPLVWFGGLGLAAAGAVVIRYWLRARKRAPALSAHSAISADTTPLSRAQAELDRLAAAGWTDADQYYEQVAEVLRRYFVEVAPGTSRAQTSRELLSALAARNANGAWTGTQRALQEADLVKFAGMTPSREAARAWTEAVRGLIGQWNPLLSSHFSLLAVSFLVSRFSFLVS
jgi:hypothetical protein